MTADLDPPWVKPRLTSPEAQDVYEYVFGMALHVSRLSQIAGDPWGKSVGNLVFQLLNLWERGILVESEPAFEALFGMAVAYRKVAHLDD